MRRVVVLALLALALPMAAWANPIDITNQFGSISITTAGITSMGSQLRSYNGNTLLPPNALGSVKFSTGVCLSGCNASGIPGSSATFSSMGSMFDITSSIKKFGLPGGGKPIFTGYFVGPITWTLTNTVGGNLFYTLSGTVHGLLYTGQYATGTTTQTIHTVAGQLALGVGHIYGLGNTILVVPEPGTLGLLGTGLVGIAGLFRRKFLGA